MYSLQSTFCMLSFFSCIALHTLFSPPNWRKSEMQPCPSPYVLGWESETDDLGFPSVSGFCGFISLTSLMTKERLIRISPSNVAIVVRQIQALIDTLHLLVWLTIDLELWDRLQKGPLIKDTKVVERVTGANSWLVPQVYLALASSCWSIDQLCVVYRAMLSFFLMLSFFSSKEKTISRTYLLRPICDWGFPRGRVLRVPNTLWFPHMCNNLSS